MRGGADALSLINTINSIMGIDLESLAPKPAVRGQGSHGGYCGPAVKPIALNMVASVAADHEIKVPISGIGGIQAWQDAVEFLLLGAGSVQVCTAVMHYGSGSSMQLQSGLESWMREKGYRIDSRFSGPSVPDQVVGRPRPELQDRRPHRTGEVHSLRPVLHRLRGWLPPIDPLGENPRRRISSRTVTAREAALVSGGRRSRAGGRRRRDQRLYNQ